MIVKTGRPRNFRPLDPWVPARKVEAESLLSTSSEILNDNLIIINDISVIKADETESKEYTMRLNDKQKTVIRRGARSLMAFVVAGLLAWLSGPEAMDLVGDAQTQTLLMGLLVPLLQMADKSLRYGKEPGENSGESVWQLRNPVAHEEVAGEELDGDHESA